LELLDEAAKIYAKPRPREQKHNVYRSRLQFTRLLHHALALCQPLHRVANHLIHNLLCALLLVHHRRRLAHQERAGVVHGVIVDVVA